MKERRGWISLHREILDHWTWKDKPYSMGQAWIDLLLLANHGDKKTYFNGELILIKRGSTITSQLKLGLRWGWHRDKVKRFLNTLTDDEMLRCEYNNRYSNITILKYNEFQLSGNNRHNTNSAQVRQQTQHELGTNNKTTNNDNNDNKQKPMLILDFFNSTLNKSLTLTPARETLINKRLCEGRTVEEMKQAILKFSKDDWTERHKFMDLVYAIGTRNKIDNLDKWLSVGIVNKRPENVFDPNYKPKQKGDLSA
jgi:hypothetical protein